MRIPYSILWVSIAFSGVLLNTALGAANDISAPAAREATLAIAVRLSAEPEAMRPEPVLKDPFYPSPGDLTDPVAAAEAGSVGITDKELLEQIAAEINPTGSVELGGEPYLLFTEKRQKIGDKLFASIGGVEYAVEIVSIGKNRFRIRYNNLETTRSIK